MLLDEGLNECIQPLPRHDIFDAVLADIHTVVCDSTLQETNWSHYAAAHALGTVWNEKMLVLSSRHFQALSMADGAYSLQQRLHTHLREIICPNAL